MYILLIMLGMAALAAAAGKDAKPAPGKKPIAKPAPGKKPIAKHAEKTQLKIVTPHPAIQKRRVEKIARAMTPKEKIALSKIKSADVKVATQTGRDVVKKLVAIAASKKTHHPAVKRAAVEKVREVAKKQPDVVRNLPAESKREIAKSIVVAEKTTPPTPAQAAQALAIYTKEGGNQGTKANPSLMVKKSQSLIGASPYDGMIGTVTRMRASALGYSLYSREYEQLPDSMTPVQAAAFLAAYTKEGGNQGTKANPSKQVARAQKLMGAAPFDGIIGLGTRAKAAALGYPLYGRKYQSTTV